jgi:hypothetical protein
MSLSSSTIFEPVQSGRQFRFSESTSLAAVTSFIVLDKGLA